MKRLVIADRKTEIEFFRAMIAGRTSERILLLQAASGKGKTDLLHRFAHECVEPFCLVRFDLKGAEKGIAQVLGVFRDKLGVEAFPRFHAALARLDPNVNISNNTALVGKMDIAVVLQVDEQTRKFRLEMLEAAFFEDLRAVCDSKIIVILDTFERAPTDLQNWLGGAFLSNIARIPHVCVVIGGQSVPERTVNEWEEICERRELRDIEDVDAWYEFVREMQLPFEFPAVKLAVMVCKGNPDSISKMFAQHAPGWGK